MFIDSKRRGAMTGAVPSNSGAVVQARLATWSRGGESEWLQEAESMLGRCVMAGLLSKIWQVQTRDIALQ